MRRPRRALRIDVVSGVAVVLRVGIDDRAGRAVHLGEQGLQAAPAAAVAGDHDLALHRDPHALERQVVLGHAVVGVDQGRGDVAIALEGDVGGKRVLGVGGRIARDRRLGQGGLERRAGAAHQLQGLADRRGVKHVEGLDLGVPAPGLELGGDPFGVGLVVDRAHMIRFGGEQLQPAAHLRRVDLGVELRLEGLGIHFGRILAQGRRGRPGAADGADGASGKKGGKTEAAIHEGFPWTRRDASRFSPPAPRLGKPPADIR